MIKSPSFFIRPTTQTVNADCWYYVSIRRLYAFQLKNFFFDSEHDVLVIIIYFSHYPPAHTFLLLILLYYYFLSAFCPHSIPSRSLGAPIQLRSGATSDGGPRNAKVYFLGLLLVALPISAAAYLL